LSQPSSQHADVAVRVLEGESCKICAKSSLRIVAVRSKGWPHKCRSILHRQESGRPGRERSLPHATPTAAQQSLDRIQTLAHRSTRDASAGVREDGGRHCGLRRRASPCRPMERCDKNLEMVQYTEHHLASGRSDAAASDALFWRARLRVCCVCHVGCKHGSAMTVAGGTREMTEL
jgi:hypothetical protein